VPFESECLCSCHGQGVYGECDDDGGCGHLHVDHRCAKAERCKGRTPVRQDDGTPTGEWLAAQIGTARGLCERCVADVEHAINHLTGDVVELTMLIGRTGFGGEVTVSASPELQIPIRVNLDALRSAIDNELQAWAEPVAEKLNVPWDTTAMYRTRMAPRVQRAAHLLSRAVDTLLDLPDTEHSAWHNGEPVWDFELDCQDVRVRDGIDGALHLVELHRLAYIAVGRGEYVVRLPQPCLWCNWRSLVRRNGEDQVVCEHCHKTVRRELLDWLAKELIKADQERPAEVVVA